MARLGIVGFTNSGKTTLFNALTGLEGATAPHPYSTLEPNLGVARVPDPRLEEAARLEGSAKMVPATLELLDLPALSRPGQTSGLGGQYLGRLREMDALVMVLRGFADPGVPDDGAGLDPVASAEELLLELAVVDHEVLARREDRLRREASSDLWKKPLAVAVEKAVRHLAAGHALRTKEWPEEAWSVFRDVAPLSIKPAVWVVNVDEGATDGNELVKALIEVVPVGDPVVAVSAKLEEEGARLTPNERLELFEGLGLGEGALALMVRAAYQGLGLISFYTVGPKESRAWSVRGGAVVPEAAGKIHSDLERGFIRAEVATMDEVIAAGGWDAAKRAGQVRVEGKTYVVVPGDVLVIRFSV